MTTVAILSESTETYQITYQAVAGKRHSTGKTAGEALDALTAQLDPEEGGTIFIVQNLHADRFFTADQQHRLAYLMSRWREARDAGTALSGQEQAELEALVEAELTNFGPNGREGAAILATPSPHVFWRRPIFPEGSPSSIVGAEDFHDRVRDGNGWDILAMTTRKRTTELPYSTLRPGDDPNGCPYLAGKLSPTAGSQ